MAKTEDKTRKSLPRRKFTDEFKEGAIRLVLDGRKPVAKIARDLDLA